MAAKISHLVSAYLKPIDFLMFFSYKYYFSI